MINTSITKPNKKFCITFAGAVGSSKTPIAHYLSYNLGLPIFSNDATRTEVTEDLLQFDQSEYIKRRDERGQTILQSGRSFIYDASVDREWIRLRSWLREAGYSYYVISLDLSKYFITRLYRAKGYTEIDRLDLLIAQHKEFTTKNSSAITLCITDGNFSDRLALSLAEIQDALEPPLTHSSL